MSDKEEKRHMPETLELVTLLRRDEHGQIVEELKTSPETELSKREVAHWTGYNEIVLRRLDQDARIPPSHRKGIARFWFARDIQGILDYKAKAQEQIVVRAGKLYKFANAARREAKRKDKLKGAA